MNRNPSLIPEDATPSPELRERVLSLCRREMAGRVASGRRWQWGLAAGVAGLLLLNAMEDGRSAVRIERIMNGQSRIAGAPPSAPHGALRHRVTLLVTLLRDPNAL